MYKAMTVDFLVEPATLEEIKESTEVKPPIWTETLRVGEVSAALRFKEQTVLTSSIR